MAILKNRHRTWFFLKRHGRTQIGFNRTLTWVRIQLVRTFDWKVVTLFNLSFSCGIKSSVRNLQAQRNLEAAVLTGN